jgi:hypothetical protein
LSNTIEVPKILTLPNAQEVGVVATREDAVFTAQRVRIYSIALVAGALILPMLMFEEYGWSTPRVPLSRPIF